MDVKKIRDEDLAVLAEIVQDKDARATDRIQAIKIREAIIAEVTPAAAEGKPTGKELLAKIRGGKE